MALEHHLDAVLLHQRHDVAAKARARGALPGGSQGGWCQAAKRKQEGCARALRAKRSCGEPGADGDVGVQHHHGGVPPGEAVPALGAERVERFELGLPAVRLDVVVAERREPGRLAA